MFQNRPGRGNVRFRFDHYLAAFDNFVMAPASILPHLNAILNATSAALLLGGYSLIRRQKTRAHHKVMVSAVITSSLFLVSYLVYHAMAGSVRFSGQGWMRPVYFLILISHTILAATVPFLAGTALVLALRKNYAVHKRIACWALPIWLYVSATGVIVYWMLYHLA